MTNPYLRTSVARSGDDGFVLLETLVSIALIAVVMAAFTTFFVGAVASTSAQRATQVATQIANSSVDQIRSLPASDPLRGHDASSVATQFNAASTTVAPWLAGMTAAVDPTALVGAGVAAAVPTVGVQQTVNNIVYNVNVYLGTCVIPAGVLINAMCATAAAGTGTGYVRAVVAVTWAGAHCPPTLCTYVTTTLLSTVDDPLFNLNQSAPTPPVIGATADQVSAVDDAVNLALVITAVPTYRVAITGGSLPAGLTLDTATGRISGTPVIATATALLTLTLTDGFGRATTTSFNWTVVAKLAGTPPAAQAGIVGVQISPLTMNATGGQQPYVWTDPSGTLPPGLSVSTAGVVTGTPTSGGQLPQTFPVVLTVKDKANRTATVPISWTISYPPFSVAVPGPQISTLAGTQNSTVGPSVLLPLTATGGSGSFTWTGGASLPPGLKLTSDASTKSWSITGTATAVGQYSVVLTVSDSNAPGSGQPAAFRWDVLARPTVASPGNQVVTTGMVVNLPLTTTCPDAPCTYAVVNGPTGLAINATGLVTGTITSAAQTFGNVTLTVTDKAGAVVSTAPFTVTVNAAPLFTEPGTITTAAGAATSVNVASLVTGGTGPLTFSATGLPAGLAISAAGVVTGTPSAAGTTTGVVLTVRDVNGVSDSTAPFNWVVGGAPSAPRTVAVVNGDGTVTISWTAPANSNGAAVTRYTVALAPGTGSCTTTGATTCSISGLTDGVAYAVAVTATNSYGVGPASASINAIPYPAVMSAANGMTLWLDGADPNVLFTATNCTGALATGASPIGCWKDKSGQNENFNQTSAANQPTVGTWNSLSAINFGDNTDVMTSINAKDTYQTAFIAANVLNPPGSGAVINLFGQAATDFNVRVGTGVTRSVTNNNDWSANTGNPALNWANGVRGANVGQPGPVITSDQSQSAQTGYQVSVSNSASVLGVSRGIVGTVGDVITFGRVLTSTERHAVEDYLAHKWAMPIKPSAPQAVSVTNGSGAITASWSEPTTGQVDSYTATASPGGASCTTTTLTCSIGGLTNGIAYSVSVTATNDFGAGPASATVPGNPFPAVLTPGNGMTLWLDGSDPNSFFASSACTGALSTTAVGCWKDKSGNGQNFSQAIAANQPGVSTWNGRSAANFADTSDVLNSATSNGQYQTVFVAANLTGPAVSPYVFVDLFGQQNQDFNVRVGFNIPRGSPNGQDWSNSTGTPPLNWSNGAQAVSAPNPMAVITTDQSQSVQSFAASVSNTFYGRGIVGQVGDVITFNRPLSAAERRSVEEYLGAKWGVVITARAPASISAARAGATSAAVTWTAPAVTGGAPVTGYTVTSSGGQTCTTTGGLNCTVSGLTTGTPYTFAVTANNAAGRGPASAASNSVTP